MNSQKIAIELGEEKLAALLANKTQELSLAAADPHNINAVIEIQGNLEKPSEQELLAVDDWQEKLPAFQQIEDGSIVVRIGQLLIDGKEAVLYVNNSQKLVGSVQKLTTPLGLLRLDSVNQQCKIIQVIEYKILFNTRPLPIM